jgi:fucose 4-O-acetylase-like acetyltransferase
MPRDRRFDVARGLLITSVVFGHLLEKTGGWDQDGTRFILTVLYAFHMPVFIFLTGITAKPDGLALRVARLLSILVLFQVLFAALDLALGQQPWAWFEPFWVLWYIAAMVWWQLTVPLIQRFPKTLLAVAVVVAFAAGAIDVPGNVLAYSRAAVFFPFFVIGNAWGNQILRLLARVPLAVKLALPVTLLCAAVALFAVHGDPHWLFGNWGYAQLGVDVLGGAFGRVALMLVAALGTSAFLVWVPARSPAVEKPGRHSLAVFIWHAAFVTVLAVVLPASVLEWPLWVRLLGDAALTVILVTIFSAAMFERSVRLVAGVPDRARQLTRA